jgi:hypothetical protein
MCSKRLKPYLAEFVEKMESCKRLVLDEEKPGFIEIDLVAHFGDDISGQYLYTLTATDIVTGWTEMIAILNKTQTAASEGLKVLRERFPFPILGIDLDNGEEFINALLFNYCKNNKITFIRCRAYKKNDQAHVEQKNGVKVRTNVGYDRFTTEEEKALLNDLYLILHYLENMFRPVMKLVDKQRMGAKVKKVYVVQHSPCKRVIRNKNIPFDDSTKNDLLELYNELGPIELLEYKNNYTARILKIAR